MADPKNDTQAAAFQFLAQALSDVADMSADMSTAIVPALTTPSNGEAINAARRAMQNEDRIRQTLAALVTIAADMADGAEPKHIIKKLKLEDVARKFSHALAPEDHPAGMANGGIALSQTPPNASPAHASPDKAPPDCELF